MTEPKFWLVWWQGPSQWTDIHLSHEAAVSEAIRLARENPDGKFFVMQALAAYKVEQPLVTMTPISVPPKGFADQVDPELRHFNIKMF